VVEPTIRIRRRRVALILLSLLGLILAGSTGRAPLFLYPSTPSLPAGLYLKVGDVIERGSIVAFPVPDAAKSYQRTIGRTVDPGFLFLKPVAAMPDDQVCNGAALGLWINGRHRGATANRDQEGRPLPVWQDCRRIAADELFTFTDHVATSFDGRYYGPIRRARVVGVYRMIWRNPWTS